MTDNPRIDDLRRRVQKDPASIAFAQLAEEYRRAGRPQEALDTCRAGLALHPGYLSARVTLGRALLELGQLDDAQEELETVLRSTAENLAAIRGLAEIHHARGSLQDALTYYKAALALAQNDPDLDETVSDLTRRLGPAKRHDPEDGLSLEEMQEQLFIHAGPLPAVAQAPPPPPPVAATDDPGVPAVLESVPAPLQALDSARSEPLDDARGRPLDDARGGSEPAPPRDADDSAVETIDALEHWLTAIHVSRTQQRS
jgi:tetratricopeptide (TPR) repeat protein